VRAPDQLRQRRSDGLRLLPRSGRDGDRRDRRARVRREGGAEAARAGCATADRDRRAGGGRGRRSAAAAREARTLPPGPRRRLARLRRDVADRALAAGRPARPRSRRDRARTGAARTDRAQRAGAARRRTLLGPGALPRGARPGARQPAHPPHRSRAVRRDGALVAGAGRHVGFQRGTARPSLEVAPPGNAVEMTYSSLSRPRSAPHARRAGGDDLLALYHRTGDRRAREQAIEHFMPLARRLAARYHRRSESFEDLVQVANLGLVKAVERYDPSRGTRFSSFAVPTISGELRRHFRSTAWNLHVP